MHLTSISSFFLTLFISALAAPMSSELDKRQIPVQGAYTLVANRPNHPINMLKIQASGQRFYLGLPGPSSYCPVQVGSSCPNTTDTVIVNGAMYVMVPGGQSLYVQRSGALAYTQAHSSFRPDYLSSELGAFTDGSYRGPGGASFAACPVQGKEGQWQVFSEVPGFVGRDCVCFAVGWKKWEGRVGAWQYT
ncbi:hypothetical protein CAC42_6440 [Sphaceloma murrayae]|uniref:Uncharacterized protein n=1 Tax=Sphaceloma murrayae TaxID=2082308 RepID=A0A2K1QNA3_9PEZI|nr:hypothetical protein CAC42_6440 [Sphaceloma murrayae]